MAKSSPVLLPAVLRRVGRGAGPGHSVWVETFALELVGNLVVAESLTPQSLARVALCAVWSRAVLVSALTSKSRLGD